MVVLSRMLKGNDLNGEHVGTWLSEHAGFLFGEVSNAYINYISFSKYINYFVAKDRVSSHFYGSCSRSRLFYVQARQATRLNAQSSRTLSPYN